MSAAAEREITVTGKPVEAFFNSAVDALQATVAEPVQRETIAMIGDDLENDVGGAINAGMQGILVRTRKFNAEELSRSDVEPTAIHDDFAAAAQAACEAA